ncbi:Uncharacterized protein dnm_049340 [Desulfonema magnum]|uniref:Uncharacterized protein n=1 Tax=Desulfonema magnum TaxID=45655 RepID=A0A975GPI3_9BACT|nr:Uncharacterized protein dnm_049340 [Desulfonema magnum]
MITENKKQGGAAMSANLQKQVDGLKKRTAFGKRWVNENLSL